MLYVTPPKCPIGAIFRWFENKFPHGRSAGAETQKEKLIWHEKW
jgi:hypothetical protein